MHEFEALTLAASKKLLRAVSGYREDSLMPYVALDHFAAIRPNEINGLRWENIDLAKHQHEGQTASWAGNSPDIIQKHYKGLVKPKDAIEFWQLTPANFPQTSSSA